jgi:2-polyprenyl-6-methoxyphenol hydroxylase-like FAD-dependent oxidoreductase
MVVKFKAAKKPTTWSVSRVTFMGDAVHVMPPTGSHGGNTALRDAALLAEKLEAAVIQGEAIEKAIGSYQEEMSKYAFREVETSKTMMKRFTIKNPLMRWAMLRAIPWVRSITNKPLTSE